MDIKTNFNGDTQEFLKSKQVDMKALIEKDAIRFIKENLIKKGNNWLKIYSPDDDSVDMLIKKQDWKDTMKRAKDESVALIYTDPPYAMTANKWDKVFDLEYFWKECKRILVPDGVVVMHSMQPFTTDVIMSNRKMFKYCWYWDKCKGGGFLNAKSQPLRQMEDICVFFNTVDRWNPRYFPIMVQRGKPINKNRGGGNQQIIKILVRSRENPTIFITLQHC